MDCPPKSSSPIQPVTPINLRQDIASKEAVAVIPKNPSRALKYPLVKDLYPQRHLVECCFSKKSPEPTAPSSLSLLSCYGCDKCRHGLCQIRLRRQASSQDCSKQRRQSKASTRGLYNDLAAA